MKKVIIALILVLCALGIVFVVHNNAKGEEESSTSSAICTESGEC